MANIFQVFLFIWTLDFSIFQGGVQFQMYTVHMGKLSVNLYLHFFSYVHRHSEVSMKHSKSGFKVYFSFFILFILVENMQSDIMNRSADIKSRHTPNI